MSKECWSGAGYFYHESFFIVPDEAIVAETVSLQIKVRDMSAGNALLTSYPIDVAIEYGPAWREMIEKVDDELEAFLRIDEVRRYTTRSGRVRTTIDINSWQLRRQEFAIGVRFELLRNDEILATTRYLHRPQTGSFGRSFEFIAMEYQGDGGRVLSDRVRIVHDPAVAVFDIDRGRMWYGESVEVPVPFRRHE